MTNDQFRAKANELVRKTRWLVRGAQLLFVLVACGVGLSVAGFLTLTRWSAVLGVILIMVCAFAVPWARRKARHLRLECEELEKLVPERHPHD